MLGDVFVDADDDCDDYEDDAAAAAADAVAVYAAQAYVFSYVTLNDRNVQMNVHKLYIEMVQHRYVYDNDGLIHLNVQNAIDILAIDIYMVFHLEIDQSEKNDAEWREKEREIINYPVLTLSFGGESKGKDISFIKKPDDADCLSPGI